MRRFTRRGALSRRTTRRSRPSTCASFSPQDPGRGERFALEAAGIYLDYSKNRITDETLRLLVRLAEESDLSRAHRCHVRRAADQRLGKPGGDARGAARAARRDARTSAARTWFPRCTPCSTRWLRSRTACAAVPGRATPASAFATSSTSASAAPTSGRSWPTRRCRAYSDRDMTFRFVSNVDGTDITEALRDLRCRRDALHHLVEDLHHPRDDDQCALGARVAGAGLGRRREVRGAPFRRGVDQRAGSCEVRHRHREHVRVLGLGGRTLLDGFGHRALDHDRDRADGISRDAERLSRDGRAFPHRAVRPQPARAPGASRCLVHQLLRRADRRRAALRSVPQALSRLSAAAHDGEQRQARDAGRAAASPTTRGPSTGASRGPTASTPSIS